MKIVFILRGFVNGGIERRVVNLANEFAACGHIVEIAAFQGECFTPVFEAADNVTFYLSGKTVKPQAPEKAADPSGSNKGESYASALSEGLKKPKNSIKRLINKAKKRLPKSVKNRKLLRKSYEKHNVKQFADYLAIKAKKQE